MPGWSVTGASDLPVKDGTWDGGAARQAVWDWAGWKGNTAPAADGGKTGRAFLLVNGDPAQKGSYHLPFARPENGTLTAIGGGVRNCASRLEQLDPAPPKAAHDRARGILDGYLKKLSGEKTESIELVTVAQITAVRAGAGAGVSAKELLKGHVLDPSVLDDAEPLLFDSTISTNAVDSYGTQMLPSSLKNFAAESAAGVPLLTSHNNRVLPLGHSYDGRHVGAQGNGAARTDASWYMMPGWSPGDGLTTDAVHQGLRWGSPRDMSAGFMIGPDGEIRCSFCGLPMLWAGGGKAARLEQRDAQLCFHMPGWSYPKLDKAGKPTAERERAVGLVDNAHLIEGSLVYSGATPGAGVKKARDLAAAGLLTRHQIDAVEAYYRMRLPGTDRVFPASVVPAADDEEVSRMDPEEEARTRGAIPEEVTRELEALRAVAAEAVSQARAALGDTAASSPLVAIRSLGQRVTELTPLAADGETYRRDLIEAAITEGKRALPKTFNETLYRSTLEKASIDVIKQMRADWKTQADELYPAGRVTTDVATAANGHEADPRAVARSYRVR